MPRVVFQRDGLAQRPNGCKPRELKCRVGCIQSRSALPSHRLKYTLLLPKSGPTGSVARHITMESSWEHSSNDALDRQEQMLQDTMRELDMLNEEIVTLTTEYNSMLQQLKDLVLNT